MREMVAVLPVCRPGERMEVPLKMETVMDSLLWRRVRPMSRVGEVGSPRRMVLGEVVGEKRTRPGWVSRVRVWGGEMIAYV